MENVLLKSELGQTYKSEALDSNVHLKYDIEVFKIQNTKTTCGFATLANMINSVNAQIHSKQLPYTDMILFSAAVDDKLVEKEYVETQGLTLDLFFNVANGISSKYGPTQADVRMHRAKDSDIEKDKMKKLLLSTLKDPSRVRIATNYHMSTAGQTPFVGHFSPLVAFHEESDMFLVMDVWPDTEPFWVSWDKLWMASYHCDGSTGLERGFTIIKWDD